MEYQEITNLLHNEVVLSKSNQPSKFRKRNWVEINDNIRGAYSPNKQIRFKTEGLAYAVIVMLKYLLKEIYQLIILLMQLRIIPIKK